MSRIYQIGTFDGGGVHGVGVLKLLTRLYIDTNNEVYFSGYAGTSTGSIIAVCLAMGMPPYKILDLYIRLGNKIFSKRNWNPKAPKYSNKPLIKELKEIFGAGKMCDIQHPVYIGYSDFQEKKTRVFDRSNNIEIWRAVLISCSAPTFFEPIDNRYCDGGLILQNPSFAGATGFAREKKVSLKNISVLSFGTNGKTNSKIKIKKTMWLWDWAIAIIKFALQGSESLSTFYCEQAGLHSHKRLEPYFDKEYKMDNPKNMPLFMEVWDLYYDTERTDLINFLNND